MKVLQIDSSALGEASVTRILTAEIVSALKKVTPAIELNHRDLTQSPPAHLDGELVKIVKFRNLEGLNDRQRQELALTDSLVDEFLASDVIVIGAPMYNFSVPSQLKAWIDRIAQAGRTFRYTENGPVGLAVGKKAYIASARGGIYSTSDAKAAVDHQESYLKTVLGFLGITDVTVIRAEGVGAGTDGRAQALAFASSEITRVIG